MKYRVLFAGIDGAGKTTSLDLLISRLQSEYSIIKIGNSDPYVYFKDEKHLAVKYKFNRIMDSIRPISIKYRFNGIFLIFNFIYKLLISKYLEVTNKNDLIMYETDTLLHPAVYVTYHFPFTKMLNSTLRFRIVSSLFGMKRNLVIFYLDTDPRVAMGRVIKRGIDIQRHENVNDLSKLKQEFDNMLKVASKKGLEIFRISTNDKNLNEVTKDIQTILEKKLCALNKKNNLQC